MKERTGGRKGGRKEIDRLLREAGGKKGKSSGVDNDENGKRKKEKQN